MRLRLAFAFHLSAIVPIVRAVRAGNEQLTTIVLQYSLDNIYIAMKTGRPPRWQRSQEPPRATPACFISSFAKVLGYASKSDLDLSF